MRQHIPEFEHPIGYDSGAHSDPPLSFNLRHAKPPACGHAPERGRRYFLHELHQMLILPPKLGVMTTLNEYSWSFDRPPSKDIWPGVCTRGLVFGTGNNAPQLTGMSLNCSLSEWWRIDKWPTNCLPSLKLTASQGCGENLEEYLCPKAVLNITKWLTYLQPMRWVSGSETVPFGSWAYFPLLEEQDILESLLDFFQSDSYALKYVFWWFYMNKLCM